MGSFNNIDSPLLDFQLEKKKSRFSSVMRRYMKNKLAVFGLILLVVLVFFAIGAGLFVDYETDAVHHNMKTRFIKPGSEHIFGTDHYGRDVFARVLYGGRISLFVGATTILLSLAGGALVGATAGYFGGKVDNSLMRIMDIFLAIPEILLAISIVAALGNSMINLMIALSVSSVPRFARVIRSSILTVKGQDFVEAAKAYGCRNRKIITYHILPNAIGPIIVQATLSMANTILMISSLSFVGLGLPSSIPEWGSMLSEAKEYMRYEPHLIAFPGVAIIVAVLAFNLIGDGLRDALDPKLKN